MNKLFHRLKSWHNENKQYSNFLNMEVFAFMAIFVLFMNIIHHSSDLVDWLIFAALVFNTLLNAVIFNHRKEVRKFWEFHDYLMKKEYKFQDDLFKENDKVFNRLVSANRRRKRAERALKEYRAREREMLDAVAGFKKSLIIPDKKI